MAWLKKTWGLIIANPGKIAVIVLVAVVFAGGMIAALYNKARAAVPMGDKLPAPRL